MSTKCPYCRRRYQHAAAYEKHVRAAHHDILLFRRQTADFGSATSSVQTSFIEDATANQRDTSAGDEFAEGWGNSDYESDPAILSHDLRSEQERVGDMEDDSDSAGVSRQPDTSIPWSRQTIPDAGRPLGDVTGYEELNQAMLDQPWFPFSSERDFNLASWFVQSKVAKTRIDDYFGKGLGGMERGSFRSAYSLEKQLETLDPFREYLSWTEARLESGEHLTTFYYRNIVSCVRYLIRQVAYKEHMVYAPIREYDSNGDQLYSEMHTADWWWETQV